VLVYDEIRRGRPDQYVFVQTNPAFGSSFENAFDNTIRYTSNCLTLNKFELFHKYINNTSKVNMN